MKLSALPLLLAAALCPAQKADPVEIELLTHAEIRDAIHRQGKTTVLGLVTTKSGEPESQETLLRRIDEASKFVAADDLALSPQCGFASMSQGNLLSWDEQRRKLDLVVETARKAWS